MPHLSLTLRHTLVICQSVRYICLSLANLFTPPNYHYIYQAALRLTVLLTLPSKCQNYGMSYTMLLASF